MQRRKRIASLLIALTICSAAGLASAGCAGELPEPGGMTTAGDAASTITTEPRTVLLGRQVAATWQESIQRLVATIEGVPPIASVEAEVAALKEEYVQKMVALGREIYGLPAFDQQTVYERTDDILASMGNDDWFLSYKSLYERYAGGDGQASQDFAVLLAGFNTLTQYAFFDMLKAQEPGEAQRLGIG